MLKGGMTTLGYSGRLTGREAPVMRCIGHPNINIDLFHRQYRQIAVCNRKHRLTTRK